MLVILIQSFYAYPQKMKFPKITAQNAPAAHPNKEAKTMDPNATLKALRQAIYVWENAGQYRDNEHALDIVDAARALDEWLTRGGFLPTDWSPKA